MASVNETSGRKNLKTTVIPYILYAFFTAISIILDIYDMHVAGGLVLVALAVVLAGYFYWRDGLLCSFPLLISLFWLLGEGLALMQLSKLQSDWIWQTWASFIAFYLFFLLSYDAASAFGLRRRIREQHASSISLEESQRRLFNCIIAVCAISFSTFITEIVILGYIPIFSRETHAYNEFHVTGVHYFTVSCMFTHALSAIYILRENRRLTGREKAVLIVCNALSLSIPILCISKFQLVLTAALPIIIYLLMRPNTDRRKILTIVAAAAAVLAIAAVVMTFRRNYEEGYLDSIFQMKDSNMPMAFQYVYMYIANNYSNFNCLTSELASGSMSYAMGLKQLFPVFALTGMKFIYPALVNFPQPVTIAELTTLTIIYDAYYDFGLVGVILFAILLGVVCACLSLRVRKGVINPLFYLFYAQIALYMALSFFSAWFSLPSVWFWLAITFAMYLYTSGIRIAKKKA